MNKGKTRTLMDGEENGRGDAGGSTRISVLEEEEELGRQESRLHGNTGKLNLKLILTHFRGL